MSKVIPKVIPKPCPGPGVTPGACPRGGTIKGLRKRCPGCALQLRLDEMREISTRQHNRAIRLGFNIRRCPGPAKDGCPHGAEITRASRRCRDCTFQARKAKEQTHRDNAVSRHLRSIQEARALVPSKVPTAYLSNQVDQVLKYMR